MAETMADPITHIRDNCIHDKKISWCGKDIWYEPHFNDIDHAAFNGRNEGRLISCKRCLTRIFKALKNGLENNG